MFPAPELSVFGHLKDKLVVIENITRLPKAKWKGFGYPRMAQWTPMWSWATTVHVTLTSMQVPVGATGCVHCTFSFKIRTGRVLFWHVLWFQLLPPFCERKKEVRWIRHFALNWKLIEIVWICWVTGQIAFWYCAQNLDSLVFWDVFHIFLQFTQEIDEFPVVSVLLIRANCLASQFQAISPHRTGLLRTCRGGQTDRENMDENERKLMNMNWKWIIWTSTRKLCYFGEEFCGLWRARRRQNVRQNCEKILLVQAFKQEHSPKFFLFIWLSVF